MLKSTEGTYSDSWIELSERPDDLEEACVVVTFLPNMKPQQLSDYGIDEAQATDLRARLRTFEEDWDRSDMDGYGAL